MKVPLVCRKYVFSLIGGKTTLLQKLLYIIKEVRLVDGRNEQCTGRQTARDGREDVDVQASLFFTLRNDAAPTRGNPYKVLLNISRMNVRRHFFTERIAVIWNSLPPSIVDFRSLSSFKRTINNANVTLFARY